MTGGAPGALAWVAWARANPFLAAMVAVFCAGSLAAMLLTLPTGFLRSAPPGQRRGATQPAARDQPSPAGASGSWQHEATADAVSGPWVDGAPAPPSPRGLRLAYRYRTRPPGSESRFDWIVQVRGDGALLDGVELVTWQMDPSPRSE